MIFQPEIHHRLAVQHLLTHPIAALFAGMGLGKTASVLTAFDGLRMMGLAEAMLVVAPLRVAALTWPNEIDKWHHLRHLKYADLRTRHGRGLLDIGAADVYLVNYEQLPKLSKLYLKKTRTYAFDIACFDELTAAKNHNSVRINRVRKKLVESRGVTRRWGLTGTPTPNGPMDLFAQIRLLDGGERLGPSHERFRDAYFEAQDYMGYSWEPRPGAMKKIYKKINDIVLSLPSETYSKIPLPTVEDVEIGLPSSVRDQYEELESQLLLLLEDETEVVATSAAALVSKLLQITGGAVYREDKSVAVLHDAKIEAARHIADKHRKQGQPLLIACHFKHEQERLLKAIPWAVRFSDERGFLAKWNSGKVPAIVCDPRMLSHGLNMQGGGHHVMWFSIQYSRETYDQLIGRLSRTGQENRVHVYRLLCPGTIDDAVAEALRQKGDGQRALMDTLHNFKLLAAA